MSMTFEQGITIGAVLAGVMVGAYTNFRKWRAAKRKERVADRLLTEGTALDIEINQVIAELRTILNAQRVSIYSFHNGDRFLNGMPFQKVTCTHQAVGGGTSDTRSAYNSIPSSLMGPAMEHLAKGTKGIPVLVVSQEGDSFFVADMIAQNVVAYTPILIHKEVGFVMIHWTYLPADVSEEAEERVQERMARIRSLLERKKLATNY